MSTKRWCVCAGSPWRVAVQDASKVGVTGSGIRQMLVGRTANVDVNGYKTPATVTVLCETRQLLLCYLRNILHCSNVMTVWYSELMSYSAESWKLTSAMINKIRWVLRLLRISYKYKKLSYCREAAPCSA